MGRGPPGITNSSGRRIFPLCPFFHNIKSIFFRNQAVDLARVYIYRRSILTSNKSVSLIQIISFFDINTMYTSSPLPSSRGCYMSRLRDPTRKENITTKRLKSLRGGSACLLVLILTVNPEVVSSIPTEFSPVSSRKSVIYTLLFC